MNLTKRIGAWRFAPGKGIYTPSPKKGAARFFFLFSTYFWSLIGVNLLFVLCCLPIVTIPASLCALNHYLIKMVRDGVGFSLTDYWNEWKGQLLKGLPAGLVCALPLCYGYYLLSMSAGRQGSGMVFAFGIFWVLLGLLFGSYVFVLLAMLELPLRALLKNVLILIVAEWKASLCVLGATVFTLAAGSLLFPYSVPVMAICWFSWLQLALCCIINELVQKRIIGPYEKQQAKKRVSGNASDASEILDGRL
ncbi:MAG TPA: DUF624 domain-containing protein [Caproiciproducens sp.]|nr:DUF624 domain-containing protein [Caproiciproducens sp.]